MVGCWLFVFVGGCYCCSLNPAGLVCAVLMLWHCLQRPRPYFGLFGLRCSAMSSMRSYGWWSAMVAGWPHRPVCLPHSPLHVQYGSRVRTAVRKAWCPWLLYGLCGLVCLRLLCLHVEHLVPVFMRFGQPGVLHGW